MINNQIKNRKIIKLLLKAVIKQEIKEDETSSVEILPFNEFANTLELTEECQCEKMYEDLGNMIEGRVDLDTAIEKFILAYNI